jgi:Holliday junction resolvase RusA-like endonuclease
MSQLTITGKLHRHALKKGQRAINEVMITILTSALPYAELDAALISLASKRLTVQIAETNGHPEPLQAALPLPVDEKPRTPGELIIVKGQPVGKPRMTRQDKFLVGPKARPCVARYRDWENRAKAASIGKVPSDIEEVSIRAYFQMPDSWPHSKKLQYDGRRHFDRPDLDNVLKAALDSILGNDEIIAKIEAEKFWTLDNPRTEVVFS